MGHHEGQHDESLIDKVKNALGMGDGGHEHEHETDAAASAERTGTDERAEGWAGVPGALYDEPSPTTEAGDVPTEEEEASGLGRNPGPVGSARYEGGTTVDELGAADADAEGGTFDSTREDVGAGEFGAAYGEDDTAMPTSAAYDRGEQMPVGEASFGTDESDEEDLDRRGTGV